MRTTCCSLSWRSRAHRYLAQQLAWQVTALLVIFLLCWPAQSLLFFLFTTVYEPKMTSETSQSPSRRIKPIPLQNIPQNQLRRSSSTTEDPFASSFRAPSHEASASNTSEAERAENATCETSYPVPKRLFAKRADIEESRRWIYPRADL